MDWYYHPARAVSAAVHGDQSANADVGEGGRKMDMRTSAWLEESGSGYGGMEQLPRLYQRVARSLMEELRSGRYPVGARMPAERELALNMGVSRPVVREAVLALEVMGFVEVRVGSGAYVVHLPDEQGDGARGISPIDLVQARLLIEGEAAALAAVNITDEEIFQMEDALEGMRNDGHSFDAWQEALTRFHMILAAATRNAAMERSLRNLWEMRQRSSECRRLLEKAREKNYRPSVEQHEAMLAAIRAHDPARARTAVRMHLEGSIEHVLLAIEEFAVAEARARVAEMRSRIMGAS